MKLSAKIESYLYYKGEPATIRELSHTFSVPEDEIRICITELRTERSASGIVVIETGGDVTLGTHPELTDFFANIRKDELEKELSKASLETLAIILYKNGTTRSDIDYIRGVNSTFILRNLLMRGLIEKTENPDDNRKLIYRPSIELLAHLGITHVSELPHFSEMKNKIVEILDKSAGVDSSAENQIEVIDEHNEA